MALVALRVRAGSLGALHGGRRGVAAVHEVVRLAFSEEQPPPESPPERAPLVVLHGLLGSRQNWRSLSKAMATRYGRRVITLDLRNHGTSPHAPEMSYAAMAADVERFFDDEQIVQPVLMGHSMGGKAAMYYALTRGPSALEGLVVVDVAPVRYRSGHIFASYIDAMMQIEKDGLQSLSQVDTALQAVASDKSVRQFLMTNVLPGGETTKFRVNLQALRENLDDHILGFPLLPEGSAYTGPTLFIAGSRVKYVTPEHEAQLLRLFPNTQISRLDTGHWVHAERPYDFMDAVQKFLATRN